MVSDVVEMELDGELPSTAARKVVDGSSFHPSLSVASSRLIVYSQDAVLDAKPTASKH